MTVAQFQRVHEINNTTPDTIERMGWVVCAIFNRTHDEVNEWKGRKFLKYVRKVERMLTAKPSRWYDVPMQTDASKINLGQFIECQHWLKNDAVQAADLVAASILAKRTVHSDDAEYIRQQPFNKVLPKVNEFVESLAELIKSYSGLFGEPLEADPDEKEIKPHFFIDQYGWIFSAKEVARHESVTLDQAFELPIIQALNDLSYLKAKQSYDKAQSKK